MKWAHQIWQIGGSFKVLVIVVAVLLGLTSSFPLGSNNVRNTETRADEAEDRVFAPPTFPYWGPFGLTSTALFCAFYVGPFAGSWNRACAGPVPPFQPTTSTTTPAPANDTLFYGGYYSNNGDYYGQQESMNNWPGLPPPPRLSMPYDGSFYPLRGNLLGLSIPPAPRGTKVITANGMI